MKRFIIDLIERAIKTASQTAIASIGVATTLGEIDWRVVGSTVAVSTILSVLTSLASYKIGEEGTASLLK